jgi:protein TonB
LTVIIGVDGHIAKVQLISGHPLLAQAAIDAVRQWVYDPTLLNGQPAEVVTTVDVSFPPGSSEPDRRPPQLAGGGH